MDYKEFGSLVFVIRSAYGKPDFLSDKESALVWFEMLKDIPYEKAKAAVTRHAMTNKWIPTIADIRESVVEIQSDKTDWSDGWKEVMTAVGRFGYSDEPGAIESMSPMTREVVKRLGWKQICQSDQNELMALRANFRMVYERKQVSEKEQAQLPAWLGERIEQITSKGELLLENE